MKKWATFDHEKVSHVIMNHWAIKTYSDVAAGSIDGKIHHAISLVKVAAFLVAELGRRVYAKRRHQVGLAHAGIVHQYDLFVLIADGCLRGDAADFRSSGVVGLPG